MPSRSASGTGSLPSLGRSPLFSRFQALFSFAATIAALRRLQDRHLELDSTSGYSWSLLRLQGATTRRQIRAPGLQPCFLSPYQSEDIAVFCALWGSVTLQTRINLPTTLMYQATAATRSSGCFSFSLC